MSMLQLLKDLAVAGLSWHTKQHSDIAAAGTNMAAHSMEHELLGVATNINLAVAPDSQANRIHSVTDTGARIFGEEFLWQWFYNWRNTPTWVPNVLMTGDSTTAGDNIADAAYRPDILLPFLAQARGFSITATNAGHSGKSSADWLATYLPADLAGAVPAIYSMRWGLNDPFYGISVAQTIKNIRTGLATIRATSGWDSSHVGLILMAPNTSSNDATGCNEAWHEAVESGLMQAARDYGAAYISPYKRLRTARNLIPTSAHQWLDAALVHPNEDHSLLITEMLRDLLFPLALADKFAASAPVVEGAGFAKVGGASVSQYVATTADGRNINLSGFFTGLGVTVAAGTLVGTIAAQHRPALDVFMAQALVWNGSTPGSSANWQQVPVHIQSDGKIITMAATTLTVARIYFNNIVIARF